MDKNQLESEIEATKHDMERMKQQHAQPYIQGFKRLYLWDSEEWERLYEAAQNKLSSLLIQKRNYR